MLAERLGLEHPVVQAGLGGGLATAPLAGAVSAAGGLGTVGILPDPAALAAEIRAARDRARGKPVAANLLVPFARRAHAQACIDAGADAVVLFCGRAPRLVRRLRDAGVLVLHQVGTAAQARAALEDGADGLIAQGEEAGGHVLGTRPLDALLPAVLDVAAGRPVLAAGGIASAERVRALLGAGAAAAVAGTRFLLTPECRAHPGYQQRVLAATTTLTTLLFSLGWPDPHRVVPNGATRRWCREDADGPRVALALNRLTAPALRRLPTRLVLAAGRAQRVALPFFGPAPVLAGQDERLLDVSPLYAGESRRQIAGVVPAAEAVRMLSPAGA